MDFSLWEPPLGAMRPRAGSGSCGFGRAENSEASLAPQAGTSSYSLKSTPEMTARAGNGGTPDSESERMGRQQATPV